MLQLKRQQLKGSVECEITIPISQLTYPINPIKRSKFWISENTWSNFIFNLIVGIKYELSTFSPKLSKRSNVLMF